MIFINNEMLHLNLDTEIRYLKSKMKSEPCRIYWYYEYIDIVIKSIE
jgi:hypothetical protein